MIRVLGRKQNIKPADELKWWDVINNIEDYVTKEEVEEATSSALQKIRNIALNKNTAYVWSGGKDSLVISDICQKAGIENCRCFITNLEFPTWLEFLKANAPTNCEFINVGFDLDFIVNHQELLFAKGKQAQFWNRNVRQKAFKAYMQEKNLDVLILGHRLIDGNVCGKNGIRIPKYGGMLYAPIYDWSHELLLAYMHYNKIQLPFIYKWRRGFYSGTHLWAECDDYQELYESDPNIVKKLATKIPSAKIFLEEMENANN